MSSNSYVTTCPNCEKEMEETSTNRPYESLSADCEYCGFFTVTHSGFEDLGYINAKREERNEEQGLVEGDPEYEHPLTELPHQDPELIIWPE